MMSLTSRLEHYLAVRRSLGYDLSTSERVLRRFAAFADAEGADRVTVGLFLRWREHFGSANINTWSAQLGMVRVFAAWLQGIDPCTEVPPAGLMGATDSPPRVIVLNSCESSAARKMVLTVAKVVVSMSVSITDVAATAFAQQFYAALASGQSIKKAFEQGKIAVEAVSLSEANTPELFAQAGVNPANVSIA